MKLTPEISEKLIEILGEEKIDEIYDIMKSKPVSFSMLKYIIRRKYLIADLNNGNTINEIVKKYSVSKMTVYRLIKVSNKKSNA